MRDTLLQRPEFKQQLVDEAQLKRAKAESNQMKKNAEVTMRLSMEAFMKGEVKRKQAAIWADEAKVTEQSIEANKQVQRRWAEHVRNTAMQAQLRREKEIEEQTARLQAEAKELVELCANTKAEQLQEDREKIKAIKKDAEREKRRNAVKRQKWAREKLAKDSANAARIKAEASVVYAQRDAELAAVKARVRKKKLEAEARKRRAEAERLADYRRRRAEVQQAKLKSERVARQDAAEEAAARQAQRKRNQAAAQQRAEVAARQKAEKLRQVAESVARMKAEREEQKARTEAKVQKQLLALQKKRERTQARKRAAVLKAEQDEVNRVKRLAEQREADAAEQAKRKAKILRASEQARNEALAEAAKTKKDCERKMAQFKKMKMPS